MTARPNAASRSSGLRQRYARPITVAVTPRSQTSVPRRAIDGLGQRGNNAPASPTGSKSLCQNPAIEKLYASPRNTFCLGRTSQR